MLKTSALKFQPINLWVFAACFSLLLLPLLRVLPNPASMTGHPWKVEFAAAVFLFAAVAWTFLRSKKIKIDLPPVIVPFLLFIAWSGASILWAESWHSVGHHTTLWAGYLLFFCLFLSLLKSEKARPALFTAFSIPLAIIAFSCFLDAISITDLGFGNGLTADNLTFSPTIQLFRVRYGKYAELLVTAAPLFWALALQVKSRKKQFAVLSVGALLWLAVIFSLSKGAFLAGICAFLVFFVAAFIFTKKLYDRRQIASLAALWLLITCGSQISFTSSGTGTLTTTDYIVGKVDKSRETSSMRIFTWKISRQMFSDNALVGVGADNFALAFNDARQNYAANNPTDKQLATAEDYMVERAHNEYLQIFAELGLIGAGLFLSLGAGFLVFLAKAFRAAGWRFSPLLWSSVAGLCGFLVSSMFSSFSFRAMQNGLVFFFVLAVAVYEAQKILRKTKTEQPKFSLPAKPVLAFATGFIFLFFALALTANMSNYFVYRAEAEKDLEVSVAFYRQALAFNPQNASAYYSSGIRFYFEKQPEKASEMLEKAIAHGTDTSLAYSYLASAYTSSRNDRAAAETIGKSLKIFPYSTFLRMRYSTLLEKTGDAEESGRQAEIARSINEPQANGWYELITSGPKPAALKAKGNESIAPPAHLMPSGGIYAVIDEQRIENYFANPKIASR